MKKSQTPVFPPAISGRAHRRPLDFPLYRSCSSSNGLATALVVSEKVSMSVDQHLASVNR